MTPLDPAASAADDVTADGANQTAPQLAPPKKEETTAVIRAATSTFGGGLRSRLGADSNVCW